MRAYHFVGDTLRDGRPIPADDEWLEHDGELVMCQSGLHASKHPLDALAYALDPTLCLVEVDGNIIEETSKLVASRRKIVARRDATTMLQEFTRAQALSVIHLWDAPDDVKEFLKTGDESLRAAARAAAGTAARAAAGTAAGAAAGAAAEAAKDAAWDAVWYAVRDAVWYAVRDAAWDAAWTAAKDDFQRRVDALFQA